jgi:hypothetical protein
MKIREVLLAVFLIVLVFQFNLCSGGSGTKESSQLLFQFIDCNELEYDGCDGAPKELEIDFDDFKLRKSGFIKIYGVRDTVLWKSQLEKNEKSFAFGFMPTKIEINGIDAEFLSVNGSANSSQYLIIGKECTIKHVNIHDEFEEIFIDALKIGQFWVGSRDTVKSVNTSIVKGKVRNIQIYSPVDTLFVDDMIIDELKLWNSNYPPKLLYLSNTEFPATEGKTKFMGAEGMETKLFFRETNFSYVDFDYSYFNANLQYADPFLSGEREVGPNPNSTKEQKLIQIKNAQRRYGYEDGLEKVNNELFSLKMEKKYKDLGVIISWISYQWWENGYNKFRVIIISLFLILIFSCINSFFFFTLSNEVYPIRSLSEVSTGLASNYRLMHPMRIFSAVCWSILYSSIIFWAIKLDFERLSFRKVHLAIWIIFQYIVGLICLGYTVNIVLGK